MSIGEVNGTAAWVESDAPAPGPAIVIPSLDQLDAMPRDEALAWALEALDQLGNRVLWATAVHELSGWILERVRPEA